METLKVERDSELTGLTTVTLYRPEVLNAINSQMHLELQEACRELREDNRTRVVIFTGAGRAFSAGADLKEAQPSGANGEGSSNDQEDPLEMRRRAERGSITSAAIEGLAQVTIAAVNGLAIGGAVVFLSAMDLRFAAASAWFSIPEIDLNIPLTWNALPRLMREMGPARTRELVMTGDRFSAEHALRWGFLNHVTADDALLPAVRSLAAKLLTKDPLSLALTKSTTRALANLMVPSQGTHSDPEYLMLAQLLARKKAAGRG
jgi:enoyl-CoA hydratase/carnithine racemase